MASKLVIVESPAKAKTIGKYLGRGYTVKASMGHVRDLPKSKLGVDPQRDFAPQYLVPRDKAKTVKELKEWVSKSREVYLATDPDREGEAIAWHLVAATGAQAKPVHRIVFHQITEDAIADAIRQPRAIDMQLVNAQQARRILDRLVGYTISPLLWKKVKSGLSAGRVQSVAVRLIVDREREIEAFVAEEYWSIEADLRKRVPIAPRRGVPDTFRATLHSIAGKKPEVHRAEEAQAIVDALRGADYLVSEIRQKETRRNPAPPFTTSTLQQEASRKLNFTARRTMAVAQQLYEGIELGKEGSTGLITYMRTDSTNVAPVAQQEARAVIGERFGATYLPEHPPRYTKKAKGAQEAHEAIRPTAAARHPDDVKAFLSNEQHRLYRLIWQRFIASQMAPAIFDSTSVDIGAGQPGSSDRPYLFRATGTVMKFPGFTAVYREGRDDDETDEIDRKALPPLERGEPLDLVALLPEQHFTQPPPRYTEATLVKALEEEGIGRPSTYAPTLETIQARGYVVKVEKKLEPTELGTVVTDLLVDHFPNVVSVKFTSRMEEELDEIASGERDWVPVLHAFYGPFSQSVDVAEHQMEKVAIKDQPAGEDCEKCGRPMLIKLGRYGKFIACSGFPECRNTRPFQQRLGIRCPRCGEGELVEKRTRKRRVFYGCERYPDCDFSLWNRPVPQPCPSCGGLMTASGRQGARCTQCGQTTQELEQTA